MPEASAEDVEVTMRPTIWGQHRRLRRCDDGPEELATMTEALAEEDEPEVSTKTMD